METVIQVLTGFNCISVAFRIVLATVLGGCVGHERSQHGQAAGLRTYILVSLGSTLTALMGLYTSQCLQLGGDAMRISAQVISGIGFLGAGAIMTKNNAQVSGLTTAAGLWAAACIGLAVGVGFYWAALLAFLCVEVTVRWLGQSDHLTRGKRNIVSYYIELKDIRFVEKFLDEDVPRYAEVRLMDPQSGEAGRVGLLLVISDRQEMIDSFLGRTRQLDYVELAIPTSK